MQQKSKRLKIQAQKNLSISRNKDVVKAGEPLDHHPKQGTPLQSRSVGISKGVTRNMGDYESFRADVWVTDFVEDDETIEEALQRVEVIVDEVLEEAVSSVIED